MISDDHPVSNFMDQFYMNLYKGLTVQRTLKEIFKSHQQIWNNEKHRKLVLAILARIGTNFLLRKEEECDVTWPVFIAQSVIALEHYNGTDDIDLVFNSRVVFSKNRDLNITGSSRRDCLKFYRKRISCKCLKKRHLEARKTTPKFGICEYCEQEKERVALSVCSRCMIYQYCSRECQVADWHEHKCLCDNVSGNK